MNTVYCLPREKRSCFLKKIQQERTLKSLRNNPPSDLHKDPPRGIVNYPQADLVKLQCFVLLKMFRLNMDLERGDVDGASQR